VNRGTTSPRRKGGAGRASAVGALAVQLGIVPAAVQSTIFQITTSTLPEAVSGAA